MFITRYMFLELSNTVTANEHITANYGAKLYDIFI